MVEPKPETFGIKYIINSNEYEFINESKPKSRDYGLTDKYCKKYADGNLDIKLLIISYIFVIKVISIIFHIDYILLISNYYKMSIQPFDKDIISGLCSIASYLFLLIFILFIAILVIAVIAVPITTLMQKIIKCFKFFTHKHKKYLTYTNSLNEYIEDLATATAKYENAMSNYKIGLINEKRKQIDFWKSLDGRTFEKELAILFQKQGYTAQLTPVTNDHGIDIVLYNNNKKIIVQCKQHAKPVGPHVVRDLFGTMVASKSDEAILACTSGFTSGVYNYVKDKKIRLMDINDILKMTR